MRSLAAIFTRSARESACIFCLICPSYFDTDMSAVKNFPFSRREKSKIQFRADFFNLFNRVPFNNPITSNVSSAFGRITNAGNAREFQLALRLDF